MKRSIAAHFPTLNSTSCFSPTLQEKHEKHFLQRWTELKVDEATELSHSDTEDEEEEDDDEDERVETKHWTGLRHKQTQDMTS